MVKECNAEILRDHSRIGSCIMPKFSFTKVIFPRVVWPVSQQYLFLPLLCCCFVMTSVLTTACFCILLQYFTSSAAVLGIPFTCNIDIPKYVGLNLSRKYCNNCNSSLWMGRFFLSIKRNQRVLHVRMYLNIGPIYTSLFQPSKFHTTLCRCLRHLLFFIQMI